MFIYFYCTCWKKISVPKPICSRRSNVSVFSLFLCSHMAVLWLSFVVFWEENRHRGARLGTETWQWIVEKKKNEGNYIAQIPHPCLELFVVQWVWSWLGAGWDGGWDEGNRGLEGGWWLSCVPSAWRKQRLLSPGLRPFIWRLSSDRSLGLSSSESSALQHAVCLSETFAEISSNAKPVLCLKCAPPRGCSYLPRGVPTVKTWDRPMGDL